MLCSTFGTERPSVLDISQAHRISANIARISFEAQLRRVLRVDQVLFIHFLAKGGIIQIIQAGKAGEDRVTPSATMPLASSTVLYHGPLAAIAPGKNAGNPRSTSPPMQSTVTSAAG